MQFLLVYLFFALVIFLVNFIPAFMPATWMVLVFIYLKYNVPLIPLVLLGVIFSTLGRIALYRISDSHFRRFLPKVSRENMATLGKYLNSRKHLTLPFILFFTFLPLPSNVVFIGAGFAKFDIKILASGFFVGRLLNYSFLVGSSGLVASEISKLVPEKYFNFWTIILQIVGFLLLFAVTKVDWSKVLRKFL